MIYMGRLKIYCSVLILVLSFNNGYCQDIGRIEYVFSKQVNEFLDEKISFYKENNPDWNLYFVLNRVTWVEERGNYLISIGAYKDKPFEVEEDLLKKSVHYYKSSTLQIPIIFDYDFAFTSYGVDSKGRVVRKNITGAGVFYIEFNRNGEIVETSN